MGTLAHGRGAMRRNAERRGGVGFSRVEDVANGTSPVGHLVVGPGAKPKGGVGRIAARQSKPEAWEVSQWEAGQSGDRRTATVLLAPSRSAHASNSDAYHSEGSYWCDPTQWDKKIRDLLPIPQHRLICRTSGGDCGTRPADLQPNARRRNPQTVSLSIHSRGVLALQLTPPTRN